jgi:hypothetical protein
MLGSIPDQTNLFFPFFFFPLLAAAAAAIAAGAVARLLMLKTLHGRRILSGLVASPSQSTLAASYDHDVFLTAQKSCRSSRTFARNVCEGRNRAFRITWASYRVSAVMSLRAELLLPCNLLQDWHCTSQAHDKIHTRDWAATLTLSSSSSL